jgi:hypothetical protein
MKNTTSKLAIFLLIVLLTWSYSASAITKGIYLTQSTLENVNKLNYLIRNAKASGINTFIIDLDIPSKLYQKNIQLVTANDITYVARIVMFPGGGTPDQVKSSAYIEKKYKLVEQAVAYGAHQIQLDYIRYNTKQPPSPQNAKDIYQIIHLFKDRLVAKKIPLQIDVFGISAFGESKYIGQNIQLFSNTIDVLCPMVYPSHYVPFEKHFNTPYETVYESLTAIKKQFPADKQLPFKLNPYIELSNYHYQLSQRKKYDYIHAQIRAVENAGADGWYAWSPHNYYDNLFHVLQNYPVK